MTRHASDAFYTTVVWLPLLAILMLIALACTGGLAQMEAQLGTTHYVLSEQQTAQSPGQLAMNAPGSHRG